MSDRLIAASVKDVSTEDLEIWVKPEARVQNLVAATFNPQGASDFCGGS